MTEGIGSLPHIFPRSVGCFTLALSQQHTAGPSLRSGLPSPATTTRNEVPVALLFRFSRLSRPPFLVSTSGCNCWYIVCGWGRNVTEGIGSLPHIFPRSVRCFTLALFQQHTAGPSLRSGPPSPATTTKNKVPVTLLFRFSRLSRPPFLVSTSGCNCW